MGSIQAQKMLIVILHFHIRAIYLDFASDMSSKSFVLSFQNFINRFRVPDVDYSDNAIRFCQGTDTIET